MKKWTRYFLFGLAFLLIFVVATVPAGWVVYQAEKQFDGLVVYGAEGTLWSGQAKALVFSEQVVRNVQWRVSPWSFLKGQFKVIFLGRLEGGQLGGTFVRSLVRPSQPPLFRDFYLRQPANRVVSLFIPPDTLDKVHGKFDISFNELQIQSNGILKTADGTILWSDAAIEQNREKIALGGFSLQFTTTRDQVDISLRDAGGAMKTELDAIQKIATGETSITGTLGYRPEANRLIVMLMSAQLNLQGEKEKLVSLQGNIKSPAGLWEQIGQ